MSAGWPPEKNATFTFNIGLSAKDGSGLVANPTIASGDFQVSTDNGALGNLGTTPTVSPASGRVVKITLSAAEMNGDDIIVVGSDAAGDEWSDVLIHIKTTTNQNDALATPADVNTQVLDVLNVDTFAEPGQEAPAATTTLANKINYLYKSFRNKITQTSTTLSIYADDGSTVDQKSTVSDDGTTFTRGEFETGP